jgi:hypothetical protein
MKRNYNTNEGAGIVDQGEKKEYKVQMGLNYTGTHCLANSPP